MVNRALFARRSPPRLRRCRWSCPMMRGCGQTPQSFANAASERSRWGLSPAAARSWRRRAGRHRTCPISAGAVVGDELLDAGLEPCESGRRGTPIRRASSPSVYRVLVRRGRRGCRGSGGRAALAVKAVHGDGVTQPCRSGHDQRFELVDRPGAVQDGGVVDDLQGADRLDRTITGLGGGGRSSRHSTARAAATASVGSALPLRRRAFDRGGRLRSPRSPCQRRCRVSPAPQLPVDSTPIRSRMPCVRIH